MTRDILLPNGRLDIKAMQRRDKLEAKTEDQVYRASDRAKAKMYKEGPYGSGVATRKLGEGQPYPVKTKIKNTDRDII